VPQTDPREVLTRPAPPPDCTVRYGAHPEHLVDFRLPRPAQRGPLVIVVHGGFWRAAYDRRHTGAMATDLAGRGYPVATIEFRRVGQDGGGWPGTFHDVAAAVTATADLVAGELHAAGRAALDLDRPILLGHSAGGQLTLWYAAGAGPGGRPGTPSGEAAHRRVEPRGVLALAPVADLVTAYRLSLGDGAVAALLGGGPQEVPDRYASADPMALLPLGVPVCLVHGEDDDRVPLLIAQRYAEAARAAGEAPVLRVLAGVEHFGLIDPRSPAWPTVIEEVRRLAAGHDPRLDQDQQDDGH
jgi:acetyl esterase/lipase